MTDRVKDNWYEDFFQGINCELWEKAVPDDFTKKEVDFLVSELNVGSNQSVLDIPCGFGRHSVELAKRGYQVTGVDISERFIKNLNKKVLSDKLPVQTILGDILTIDIKQKFAGAVCMGNSFGYFDIDKMKLFVDKVSSCLTIGSKFIINSGMIAESILANFPKNKSFTVENITMDITNTYNEPDSYMISNIVYTKENVKEEHSFKHYVFTLGEVKRLLKGCGFKINAVYSSPAKEEFKLGDPQIYIVAEKEK
jgi:cyclopropane fatty-acyl-phospholipid synthase-like methyltransferase